MIYRCFTATAQTWLACALHCIVSVNCFAHGDALLRGPIHRLSEYESISDDDDFGYKVAIDNQLAVVGARFRGDRAGEAFVYDATTGQLMYNLLPSELQPEDRFGASVAVGEGRVLVGAVYDDDQGPNGGAAYLFDAATGQQVRKFTVPEGDIADFFGSSVAIDDGLALIGAQGVNQGSVPSAGAAYLFDLASGARTATLVADDAGEFAALGFVAAMDDGIVIAGAPGDRENGQNAGAAYLFDAATGNQLAKLTPNGAQELDNFAWSVDIRGDLAIVGAPGSDAGGIDQGAAYLFEVSSGTQLATLTASDVGQRRLGESVALSDGIALVGTSTDDDHGTNAGAVYVFDTTNGNELGKIIPEDIDDFDHFGSSLAAFGTRVIAGADNAVTGAANGPGVAYLFSVVPEPSSGLLLAMAIFLQVGQRRFLRDCNPNRKL